MVFVSTDQMNQAAPASELIQSMVAPSCSAAKTRSPPSLVADAVAVVFVVSLFLFDLLLPQAAPTSDSARTAAPNALTFFTSRTVSRPPCPVHWMWLVPVPRTPATWCGSRRLIEVVWRG